MRKAVRAIVTKDEQLLVMHRNKFGHEYYTLIGGGIDFGETPEQSLLREIEEETGIKVKNERLVFVEHAGDPFGVQYIYHCDYVSGEPKLPPGSIEAQIAKAGNNLYTPMWLPIKKLPNAPFLSETLKKALIVAFEEGFPKQPKELHSSAEVRYTG